MTVNQAINQAREEISMYRQGRGWVVTSYDPSVRCDRLSGETHYYSARGIVRRDRIERALCLLGKPYHAATAGTIETGRFEDHVRRLAAKPQ